MNKSQLEYFMALMKFSSMSRAADECHISRQALSRAISDMESKVGCELFLRTNNGLVPTQTAIDLVPHVSKILEEYKIISDLSSLSSLSKNEVRIYTYDAFIDCLSSDFFLSFTNQHPNILLNIEESTESHACDMLRMHQCDFAIVTDAITNPAFTSTFLFDAKYGILVRKDDPLAEKDYIRFEDLSSRKIIGKNRHMSYYWRDTNYILTQGYPLDFTIEVTNNTLRQKLVESGMGIALAWDFAALCDQQLDSVVFKPFEGDFGCKIYLLENEDSPNKKLKKIVKNFILSYIYTRQLENS